MCSCTQSLAFRLLLNIITVWCKRLLSFLRFSILNVQTIVLPNNFLQLRLDEFFLRYEGIFKRSRLTKRLVLMIFEIDWSRERMLTFRTHFSVQNSSESLMRFIFDKLNMSSKMIRSYESFRTRWTWKSLLNDWDTRNLLIRFVVCEIWSLCIRKWNCHQRLATLAPSCVAIHRDKFFEIMKARFAVSFSTRQERFRSSNEAAFSLFTISRNYISDTLEYTWIRY